MISLAPSRRAAPQVLEAGAAFALAAACFWGSRNLSLELSDEGQLIYQTWRVSQGALPYVDVRQLYAPSVFFLNGALLHWFGADLSIIRISLLVIKAAVATLVYVNARLITSRSFAVLAYVLTVAIWMTPWWVFNTPYANHYSLLCAELAVFGFLVLWRRHQALACVWAGMNCGIAATFKQTGGLFAVLAFALFIVWDTAATRPSGRPETTAWSNTAVRSLRWLALLATIGVAGAYVVPGSSFWNAALLLAPTATTVLLVARREWHSADVRARWQGARNLLYLGAGMMPPLAVYPIYYAARGHLQNLVDDTIVELPRRTVWFDPLPVPSLRPSALVLALFCLLLSARLAALRARAARVAAMAAVAVAIAAVAAVAVNAASSVGLGEYVRRSLWYQDMFATLYVLPFAVVWASIWFYLATAEPSDSTLELPPVERRTAASLWSFFCATSLLLLYPSGDLWHLLMCLPAFLPLFAALLERYAVGAALSRPPFGPNEQLRNRVSRPERRLAATFPTIASVLLVVMLATPFFGTTRFVRSMAPGMRGAFTRASGIVGWPPKSKDAADLVAYIDAQPQEQRLFVLCNEQLLYFLTGRPSVMERDEFALYLVGAGVITPNDRRALLDEARIVARLRETKPLVVDCTNSPLGERFKTAFPEVERFLADHYAAVASFGDYRLLTWTPD